jgi:alkylation response protein AidB-like acyl-CoA dehydrogenase
MDFSLTDRQKALRERLESFCSEHCTEKEAARLDREPAFPAELYRALVDSGLLGYCLPERYGGEGGGALDADYILTAVRSDPEARPSRGISLFLVPRETPGLHIAPMEKIAGNAIASCRVTYDGVQVTKDALLGAENGAWPMLMLGGGFERVVVAASAVGAAAAALDEMLHFAREREQFGQPIGGFQAIQHQLADVATEIEAARLLVYRAAWQIDGGQQPVKEVSMAKLYASERLTEILMRGMRLLGGRAYLAETPMPRRLREAMLGLYAGGTAEIQRNLIARQLGAGTPRGN